MGRVAALVAVVMLVAVACGGGDATVTTSTGVTAPSTTTEPTTAPGTSSTTTAAPPEGAIVGLASGELGGYLVDGEGSTLYLFLDDEQGSSTCYEACAVSWPPLTGEATAGSGVEEVLLGTTPRSDGAAQVTYAGRPLYRFSGDTSPGDINGQGLSSAWFMVDVEGNPIGQAG